MEGCGVGRVRVKEWLVLSGSESSRNNTSKHVEINVPTTKNGAYILTLEPVLVFQDATNTFRQIQAKYLLDNERPTDYGG